MKKEFIKRILSSFILIPIVLFFIIKGSFLFNFFICICFLIICYEWNSMTKNKKYNIEYHKPMVNYTEEYKKSRELFKKYA